MQHIARCSHATDRYYVISCVYSAQCTVYNVWHPSSNQVRVAERSVEGRHARINQIQRRAQRASVAYYSYTLRFCYLQRIAATAPACLQSLLDALHKLETSKGLVKAVMWLGTGNVGGHRQVTYLTCGFV